MSLSRRDAVKLGGLAALGAAAVAVPLNQKVTGSSVSRLPAGRLPQPYVAEFKALDVLSPVTRADADGPFEFYDLTARTTVGQILPGLDTIAELRATWGRSRGGPAAADRRRAGHPDRPPDAQPATTEASDIWYPHEYLDPPARFGVAAAVRWVHQ